MHPLNLFGLFAVTAMLVCYALEDRDDLFILAFAAACALGSVLWIFAARMAIWPRRGGLGRGRAAALERQAAMT